MNYLEATETKEITRKEALREVKRNYAEESEFLAEVGDKEIYTGEEVLGWLGY